MDRCEHVGSGIYDEGTAAAQPYFQRRARKGTPHVPELTWIGKDKVITHHLDVPFRVLDKKYSYGAPATDDTGRNLIVHGDNLAALKALLPTYEKKVDVIYIDPPYNTGTSDWVYNDNVDDPVIRRWLGEVVGPDGIDLSRHDKWLSMMYPRLRLLARLLAPRGALAISIGHHELHRLISMLEEIFATRQIVTITVQTSGGKPSAGFNVVHEYLVLVVPKDFEANKLELFGGKARTPFEGLTLSTYTKVNRANQCYPIYIDTETETIASIGPSLQELVNSGDYTGNLADYPYDRDCAPEGTVAVWPVTSKGKQCVWRLKPQSLRQDWEKGYIKVSKNVTGQSGNLYSVQYLPQAVIGKVESGEIPTLGTEPGKPTLLLGDNVTEGGQIPTMLDQKIFRTTNGTNELASMFPNAAETFTYPKPRALVETVITLLGTDDCLVLDSFAGSGTAGHAVLNLNARDGGTRNFILVELGDYADTVTAERCKKAIDGYEALTRKKTLLHDQKITATVLRKGDKLMADLKELATAEAENFDKIEGPKVADGNVQVIGVHMQSQSVPGLGGGFDFLELGEPLLVGEDINPHVPVESIREYVFFTDTGTAYEYRESSNEFYLGQNNDTAYYFYYVPDEVTTLDHDFLATLDPEKACENHIIYADRCVLSSDQLNSAGVIFKKIPRDITRL